MNFTWDTSILNRFSIVTSNYNIQDNIKILLSEYLNICKQSSLQKLKYLLNNNQINNKKEYSFIFHYEIFIHWKYFQEISIPQSNIIKNNSLISNPPSWNTNSYISNTICLQTCEYFDIISYLYLWNEFKQTLFSISPIELPYILENILITSIHTFQSSHIQYISSCCLDFIIYSKSIKAIGIIINFYTKITDWGISLLNKLLYVIQETLNILRIDNNIDNKLFITNNTTIQFNYNNMKDIIFSFPDNLSTLEHKKEYFTFITMLMDIFLFHSLRLEYNIYSFSLCNKEIHHIYNKLHEFSILYFNKSYWNDNNIKLWNQFLFHNNSEWNDCFEDEIMKHINTNSMDLDNIYSKNCNIDSINISEDLLKDILLFQNQSIDKNIANGIISNSWDTIFKYLNSISLSKDNFISFEVIKDFLKNMSLLQKFPDKYIESLEHIFITNSQYVTFDIFNRFIKEFIAWKDSSFSNKYILQIEQILIQHFSLQDSDKRIIILINILSNVNTCSIFNNSLDYHNYSELLNICCNKVVKTSCGDDHFIKDLDILFFLSASNTLYRFIEEAIHHGKPHLSIIVNLLSTIHIYLRVSISYNNKDKKLLLINELNKFLHSTYFESNCELLSNYLVLIEELSGNIVNNLGESLLNMNIFYNECIFPYIYSNYNQLILYNILNIIKITIPLKKYSSNTKFKNIQEFNCYNNTLNQFYSINISNSIILSIDVFKLLLCLFQLYSKRLHLSYINIDITKDNISQLCNCLYDFYTDNNYKKSKLREIVFSAESFSHFKNYWNILSFECKELSYPLINSIKNIEELKWPISLQKFIDSRGFINNNKQKNLLLEVLKCIRISENTANRIKIPFTLIVHESNLIRDIFNNTLVIECLIEIISSSTRDETLLIYKVLFSNIYPLLCTLKQKKDDTNSPLIESIIFFTEINIDIVSYYKKENNRFYQQILEILCHYIEEQESKIVNDKSLSLDSIKALSYYFIFICNILDITKLSGDNTLSGYLLHITKTIVEYCKNIIETQKEISNNSIENIINNIENTVIQLKYKNSEIENIIKNEIATIKHHIIKESTLMDNE